jgi:hypothetical protein
MDNAHAAATNLAEQLVAWRNRDGEGARHGHVFRRQKAKARLWLWLCLDHLTKRCQESASGIPQGVQPAVTGRTRFDMSGDLLGGITGKLTAIECPQYVFRGAMRLIHGGLLTHEVSILFAKSMQDAAIGRRWFLLPAVSA